MQVENGIAVEASFFYGVNEKLDGLLVVQNHLSLTGILTLGLLAKGDEPLGFKE